MRVADEHGVGGVGVVFNFELVVVEVVLEAKPFEDFDCELGGFGEVSEGVDNEQVEQGV